MEQASPTGSKESSWSGFARTSREPASPPRSAPSIPAESGIHLGRNRIPGMMTRAMSAMTKPRLMVVMAFTRGSGALLAPV